MVIANEIILRVDSKGQSQGICSIKKCCWLFLSFFFLTGLMSERGPGYMVP